MLLKRIFTGTAIVAAPITYMLDGVQFVAVLAGAGGPQNVSWSPGSAASRYENFERLLVFKLDGGEVPLPPRATPPPRAPTPAPIAADAQTLVRGKELFEQQCARCHQEGGGTGAYPDLWNMPRAVIQAFEDIVYGGALRESGMGNFSDSLSRPEVAAIKAFIVDDEITRRAHRPARPVSRVRFH
jgi:quinohemoprotein ethanol dehydrogenase